MSARQLVFSQSLRIALPRASNGTSRPRLAVKVAPGLTRPQQAWIHDQIDKCTYWFHNQSGASTAIWSLVCAHVGARNSAQITQAQFSSVKRVMRTIYARSNQLRNSVLSFEAEAIGKHFGLRH